MQRHLPILAIRDVPGRVSLLAMGAMTATFALLAATAISLAAADASSPPVISPIEETADTPEMGGGRLLVGDKLQVNFFEHLEFGQGAEAGMNAGVRTFYQRLDLTGEYVVDADGTIIVPLLGRFTVGGLTPEEAQAEIKETYELEMDRGGDVHIAIVERQPVFVTGIVRNPGSFPYQPGMIALQAVALAGGFDRSLEASARILDAMRERERHDQAREQLDRLQEKRLRLIRQRDAQEPTEKFGRNGPVAEENVAAAGNDLRLLEAELAAKSGETHLLKARVDSARGEAEALESRVGLVKRQIGIRSERLEVLQKMQGRGLATIEVLWNAQKDVADFEMQREQLTSALQVAQQRIVEVEAERTKTTSDRAVIVERELAAAESEIAQLENTLASSRDLLAALELKASADSVGPQERLQMQVLRRTSSGVRTLTADEFTDLMPGDVVNVEKATVSHTADARSPGSL